MRIVAALVICFATAISSANQRPEKLTVELRAAPLPKLLAELSRRTGLSLETSPQTEREVVLLAVKDQPVDAVLKRIAEAVNATWRTEGEGRLRLIRTSEQAREEQLAEQKRNVEAIRRAMEAKRKELEGAKPWTGETADSVAVRMAALSKRFQPNDPSGRFYEQARRLSSELPATRAVNRMLLVLNPAELAAVEPRRKVVWSSAPTRVQRALPPKAMEALASYARDMVLWQEAKERHRVGPLTYNGMTYYYPGFGDHYEGRSTASIQQPAKALLTVSRYGREPAFTVQLILADASGRVISRVDSQLYEAQEAREEAWKDEPAKPGEPVLELKGEDLELVQVNRMQAKLSDGVRAKLLDPERYDPLSLVTSSTLLQMARAKGVNLVASLADSMFYIGGMTDKPLALSRLEKRLKLMGVEIREEAGWMVFKPVSPIAARRGRIARKALAEHCRRAISGKAFTLEEEAALALSMPDELDNSLPFWYKRLVAGADVSEQYYDMNVLRLFGTLTPEQKRAALSSGLPFRSLQQHQIALLERIVFGLYTELQPKQGAETDEPVDWDRFYNSTLREPTESLPNGLLGTSLLKMREDSEEVIRTMPIQHDRWTRPGMYMSAHEFAWQMFSQERPEMFPWMESEGRVDLTKLGFGKRRQVHMTFELTPKLELSHVLAQHDMQSGQPMPFAKLPADFVKKVNENLEELKKQYANAGPGPARQRANIPPSP